MAPINKYQLYNKMNVGKPNENIIKLIIEFCKLIFQNLDSINLEVLKPEINILTIIDKEQIE